MANELTVYGGMKLVVPAGVTIAPQVLGALALCYAQHPKEQVPDETVMMFDAHLKHFDAELLKVATIETLYRQKWFPKPAELADTARKITTLITSRGMYLRDEASRKRIAEIRAWQSDMHPETAAFIERRREAKHS